MTGFFEELSEVIMQVIIRPASIDPPPLRIGSVSGGYAARALARYAAIHSAERPPHMGACANAAAFVLPPLFRIGKQKRLKENSRSRFPSQLFFFLFR